MTDDSSEFHSSKNENVMVTQDQASNQGSWGSAAMAHLLECVYQGILEHVNSNKHLLVSKFVCKR